MDGFLFGFLLLTVFVLAPISIGILLYYIPKKFGYIKTGKYLLIAYFIAVGILLGSFIFYDRFFTKNNAEELIEDQGIYLNENFTLDDNKSMIGIGDYYKFSR